LHSSSLECTKNLNAVVAWVLVVSGTTSMKSSSRPDTSREYDTATSDKAPTNPMEMDHLAKREGITADRDTVLSASELSNSWMAETRP
jgi:hypothetical protein